MKTLKLFIKTRFFNKINDFFVLRHYQNIVHRRSNKVLISYIIKINAFNQDVQASL